MKRKKPRAPDLGVDELLAAGQAHAERGELAEAEAAFRAAVAGAPDHPAALCLFGLLLVDLEKTAEAIDVLERAREIAPEAAPVQLALGTAYSAAGHDGLAVAAMETALRLEDASTLPLERLAKHHLRAGRTREAIGYLRRVLRRDPAHGQAKFLLAGLTSDPAAAALAHPPDLIAELFDTYAPSFDQHLTQGLQYGVPRALAALLVEAGAVPDGSWLVVDLGCGTGLAGVEVRPFARRLVGSDLAPRMVERARRRGIYDELHREDLAATLARTRDADLIVAADVLIYVGALEATFAACAAALRPGGLFAFSVERSAAGDMALATTLRSAHAPAYVARVAAANGLAILREQASVLRVENDRPVEGLLYVLRR